MPAVNCKVNSHPRFCSWLITLIVGNCAKYGREHLLDFRCGIRVLGRAGRVPEKRSPCAAWLMSIGFVEMTRESSHVSHLG